MTPTTAARAGKQLRKSLDELKKTSFGRQLFGRPWALTMLAALALSLLITPHFRGAAKRYHVGRYAEQAIKATHDVDVEDPVSTEKRRQEAAATIYPIYDFDDKAAERQCKKAEDAFAEMRATLGNAAENAGRNGVRAPSEEAEARIAQMLGVSLDRKTSEALARDGYSAAFEAEVHDLLNYALSRLIVADRKSLLDQVAAVGGEKAIKLRDLTTRRERPYANLDEIVDAVKVQTLLERRARQNIEDPTQRAAAVAIAGSMVAPTLDFNMAETEERRAAATADIGPSIIHFRKGQLIVAEGQQITEEHARILTAMQEGSSAGATLATFLAIAGLLFLAGSVVFRFGQRYIRKFQPEMNDYAFLVTTAVFAGMMAWLGKAVAPPLADSFSWLTRDAIRFLFPVAGFGMIVRFLLYSEAALIWLPFVTLACGLIVDGSLGYAAFMLIGSTIGAHEIGQAEASGRVLRAGLLVAVGNLFTAIALQAIGDPTSLLTPTAAINVAAAFLGGLLTGPFVLAAVPPLEMIFGYTSNLRLMELANLNHPLLSRMLVEAPGTYHHSLMVSALAEKGAESVGANPLLVKVAALYHDIGKVTKPHYFIENQIEGLNPHDALPPHMSSLILINHVREGVDLAQHYRLGRRIQQVIAEHHGRSRINYFYNRAKQSETPDRERVNEEDFRYRGPRPQSREAAVVMLADVVEAATRSLKQPTPARIEATVNELIGAVYNDGQLDECEMTLRNLHNVALQFTTLLTGRYHGRIQYPETEQPRKGKVVNLPSHSAPSGGGSS